MESWYLFSLAALLLLGSQRFLYKVAAERGCNSALTSAIFMATVTILSGISYLSGDIKEVNITSLVTWSLINSSSFACATIFNIEALKRLPASVTFPLTRTTIILVTLFSLVYFDEILRPFQWIGLLTAFGVVVILLSEIKYDNKGSQQSVGLAFVTAAIACSAVSSISCKFAAVETNKAAFMTLTYLLATIFSLLINKRWKPKSTQPRAIGPTLIIGLAMGGLNFIGFYALLSAMETGPLSAIITITGMQFIIAILLAVVIYHEKMSSKRILAIVLALATVVLMKQ